MANSAIVTEAHLAQINTALEQAKAAQGEIELAKRAGIDVTQQEAALKEGVAKLQQIKQVYFPNQ